MKQSLPHFSSVPLNNERSFQLFLWCSSIFHRWNNSYLKCICIRSHCRFWNKFTCIFFLYAKKFRLYCFSKRLGYQTVCLDHFSEASHRTTYIVIRFDNLISFRTSLSHDFTWNSLNVSWKHFPLILTITSLLWPWPTSEGLARSIFIL